MTRKFTITGSSTTRPTGLPAGFEVEEADEPFDRYIGAEADDAYFGVRVQDYPDEGFDLNLLFEDNGRPYEGSVLHMDRHQVAVLRDALTEWLGDAAEPKALTAPAVPTRSVGRSAEAPRPPEVVNHGDPEPPRDAVYVDKANYVWSYSTQYDEWCYDGCAGDTWQGLLDRGPGETLADFPWTLKTA